MTITERDRRILIVGAVIVPLIFIYRFAWPSGGTVAETVVATRSIPIDERRLTTLRQIVGAKPGRERLLEQVSAELKQREKGLIRADSTQQAQAQIVQVLRKIGSSQSPPLEFRGVELGPVRPFGNQYGEAAVTISFDAQIEQLVQFLADLTAQRELIATNDLRIGQAHPKQKSLPIRLTVSGIVPKSLLPAKKGAGAL